MACPQAWQRQTPIGMRRRAESVDVGVDEHRVLLLRHGETEWSKTGRHTGVTDLDVTETGRRQAVAAQAVLADLHLDHPLVICSPRRRALRTAEFAGLTIDEISDDLAEWDYGRYEGQTIAEIRHREPGWLIWTHGADGGESVPQVSARADRVIDMALRCLGSRDVVLVSHGHFCRAVITRWLELPLTDGARFAMPPASIAVCGFEHQLRQLCALGLTGPGAPRP